ncbi:MAG: glycine cleavage system aminomethyltransferase T, aminomethyltransferase [Candidatus Peregrinibacteria bacterium GW2011_GWF2_33_10]|nr:MAG: glycine cleavage system aminomethyltransferase T, aminomethyltransferase [Candidatus Peregrinibacteria bacterium GW2011_GWF2_33_10]OGJ45164.1 MAG: glycine cleavage system protein T [Candidatus Peregrinibacteria bacterium RIFOXYA12_FULL_33_12]OGJ45479.1 MAG: glycine cleavage system protein T [Candidatus Peregrinibacteria bacterium RIFOXYA2_FULL_33_21]OGJ51192.1 MAG: glycine cleavage system protein T [Candidatus Peregrinibacteria bacterium RIFOXYB2_FULL_33_20]
MLLKTPLNEVHKKLGARMVDFGGWEMPVVYTNQIEEHHAVRKFAGIFDVSHMGEIMFTGKDAFNLIQKLVSRDISAMDNGKVMLCVLCNEQGGIIDDLTVYKFNEEKYMLVVNAGTQENDYQWMIQHKQNFDVEVKNVSFEITKLDLQGPNAQKILQKLTKEDLNEIKRYRFKEILIDNVEMIVSRSGYTGEDGFELYFLNQYAEQIWNKIMEIGKNDGLIPCGLGSRDTLRTECGMMLYGHDIDTNMTPFESVYGFAVSLNKNFIGKEVLEKQKNEGTKKKLVGFEMIDRGIARQHYSIFKNGEKIGEVTSGTPSPTLNKNIGMGYVRTEDAIVDSTIEIQIRDNFAKAKIVSLPFYVRTKN